MEDEQLDDVDPGEVMPDPDAEPAEQEAEEPTVDRAKLNKQIAAARFKIANPRKFGRQDWEPDELARHATRLEELLALRPSRGPAQPGRPRERRGPADLLAERRSYTAHAFDVRPRSSYGLGVPTPAGAGEGAVLPAPTIEDLMRHAGKHGPEQVVETAVELGFGHDACVRLMDHCDRSEAAAYRRERPKAPPLRFGDSEARVASLMGATDG